MKEYITTYLDVLDNPEIPGYYRRGLLDILSRVTVYMEEHELKRYKAHSDAFRVQMKSLLSDSKRV